MSVGYPAAKRQLPLGALVANHHGSAGLICSSVFVKIVFTWQKPASAVYEAWNTSTNCSTAALSLRYLPIVLLLLQYSARFLLLKIALAWRFTCISISSST